MADVESKSSDTPGWASTALAAEFEPLPRVGPLQAARRHLWMALLPVLVLVPVVAIVAAARQPTYSAEARLMVGRLNISTPGAIQGYAQAAQDLASTYPLVIDADGVIGPVARQFHLASATVRSAISATQVPGSSIVRVDATSKSATQAVQLANAASSALVSFLTHINRNDPDVANLLKDLQSAELNYQHAAALAPPANHGPTSPAREKAAAAADVARVQVSGAVQAYQTTLMTQAVSSLLQPISDASSATSDRASKLELSLLIALVAGIIIGLAAVTARANLALRRALTVPQWQPPFDAGPPSTQARMTDRSSSSSMERSRSGDDSQADG